MTGQIALRQRQFPVGLGQLLDVLEVFVGATAGARLGSARPAWSGLVRLARLDGGVVAAAGWSGWRAGAADCGPPLAPK